MKTFRRIRRVGSLAALLAIGITGLVWWRAPLYGAETPTVIGAPLVDSPKAQGSSQSAVLAGGCFWGVQGVFQHVIGVQQVVSGYSGGDRSTAHYDMVSSGNTGHAESVKITFDPAQISYGQILQIAFSVVHDPTQLNRQGPDSGTQYRSVIFYADETQRHIAEAYIAQLEQAHAFSGPIVTRVDPLKEFYPAEGYHQDYLDRHPSQSYIVYNDLPKIENFRHTFPQLYREKPVLTATR